MSWRDLWCDVLFDAPQSSSYEIRDKFEKVDPVC